MARYQAPLRDMKFLLYDVLEIGSYSNLPRFSDAPRDVVEAVLEGGAAFASEVLQPINAVGDKQGYINVKGYYEFNASRRPDGWNMWFTFAISPAAQMPPPRSPMIRK